jgi:translation elongation factor EF-4
VRLLGEGGKEKMRWFGEVEISQEVSIQVLKVGE